MLGRCLRAGSGHLRLRSSDVSEGAGSTSRAWSCSRESHWWGSLPSEAARCRCEWSSIGQGAIARSAKAHGIQTIEASSGIALGKAECCAVVRQPEALSAAVATYVAHP